MSNSTFSCYFEQDPYENDLLCEPSPPLTRIEVSRSHLPEARTVDKQEFSNGEIK